MSRIIDDPKFLASLKNGKLKDMLNVVLKDKDLDIQIRDNYLNVYYKGSNAARVRGENRIEFDEYYFYVKADGFDTEKVRKARLEHKGETHNKLIKKRNELTDLFQKGDHKVYFNSAKAVIDKWLKEFPRSERGTQHILTVSQQLKGCGYVRRRLSL